MNRSGSRFDELSNFRDVGGRYLRTGLLYRSEELSRLTSGDVARLAALGLRTICDLRSPRDHARKPPVAGLAGVRLVNIPLQEPGRFEIGFRQMFHFLYGGQGLDDFQAFGRALYHHLAFERVLHTGRVLTLLASDGALPALIHCAAGKDRTGFAVALLQSVAGAPYEAVREEYLRTNEQFGERLEKLVRRMRLVARPERLRFLMRAHVELLDEVHGAILERHGTVERYLIDACGVAPEAIARLQDSLRNGRTP